ncbi:nucleotidyltransferase domain-containing protein [Parasphingorhabdus halotolerans]|uniref:Nucleotidyltransferase family protein n=1 Tax=Parasphingorhabdus halotolerans TaxID=2725558 RepID=A0A6H2DRN1_9SPHN|nr:nucleotidyltransferase family protein [Parasphingorhabdus halotolerans]QJB70643.1 nucleotidyltransferase family protein [Parasphingorhabdus halotolerans]
MRDAMSLVRALRDPSSVASLNGAGWTQLISIARAESLMGSLAHRLRDIDVPDQVKPILQDAIEAHDLARKQALWEADCARRALADLDCKVVLMKGTAYVAANLQAGIGRSIGDLDIMVARDKLQEVEEALLDAGWEWVKPDPYDDQYYREHMHELPPLIHRERDRMIDVHHTILPLTAKPKPDAANMMDCAVGLDTGLDVLDPGDMIVHSAAHLMADGDLAGGLRNLWDIDQLVRQFTNEYPDFLLHIAEQAWLHELSKPVNGALRLANQLYGTPLIEYKSPMRVRYNRRFRDRFFVRRLLARDGYGRETRKFTRFAFYVRSHWLRMPPLMLARHLWTKWRKGVAAHSK